MELKAENRKVVTKCDIKVELENDREILAMKNICSIAEQECFRMIRNPKDCKKELEIIKQIRSAINGA